MPTRQDYLAPMTEPTTVQADVHLHPGREKGLLRGHPWVFSGAIHRIEVEDVPPAPGDWVRVLTSRGASMGWGHWGAGSIAVRLITDGTREIPPDAAWWNQRLAACLDVRNSIGITADEHTTAFRLVHGEGDGLSGLVVDWYDGVAVVQTHSHGMARVLPDIASGLRHVLGDALEAIVNKSEALLDKLPGHAPTSVPDGVFWSSDGAAPSFPRPVKEHGLLYAVDPLKGQKTGFFIDQRDSRRLLMEWVGKRTVLNAFSYTGGFSMAALQGGSPKVISLDASEPAIEAACHHAEINGFAERHEGIRGDVMEYLQASDVLPEVVVLDPPAYAKSRSSRHKAVQGYKRLNATALRKMPSGGLLWTFSCSQVVDAQLFEDTIVAAAVESGRQVRILRRLGQPGDHPTRAGHGEARYLKGLILHVV